MAGNGEASARVPRESGQADRGNTGVRWRITEEVIERTVGQIVERFQPERVVLFGSYAYGKPGPDSDLDLLVIMDTPVKEIEQAIRICQGIEYHFPLDLIVRTPANLAWRLAQGDFFLREVTERGKVLYERADGRVGSEGRG